MLVADKLSDEGLAVLRARPEFDVVVRTGLDEAGLAAAAATAHALVVRSGVKVTAKVLAAAPLLRVVGRAGIGVDNIDVAAATRHGVLVMNSPDANANTTAEHALSLIFALARAIPAADRSVRAGKWERTRFVGTELAGKVLGVIGGGNIGRRVAAKAKALGLHVLVHDPYLAADALRAEQIEVVALDALLARSDIVTIHVPLLDSTRNLIDAAAIARMKPGARIVNCARGGIVAEQDLAEALRTGRLAGAALDVFEQEPPPADHPLLSLDNVVLTPHLGASTAEAQSRASLEICEQVLAYLSDGEVKNAVNLPRVAPAVLAELAPWIELGRRLGRLAAGLAECPCDRLEVGFQGRLAALDTSPVARSIAAGFLAPALAEPVNLVNALAIAEQRGIRLEERRSERVRDFASMISVAASGAGRGATVAGTLFGHRQPRVVRIDDYQLEAIAEGPILVVRNADRPGVIGNIGSLLGAASVNIRAMHLAAPELRGGPALAVLNTEPEVPAATLDSIRRLPEVLRANVVRLDEGTTPL